MRETSKADRNPKVSVIMPSYMQARFVGEAIESLLAQTYRNWEVAVVDDGSPDGVAEIVREYAERDNRIHFWHTENRGVSAARNFAVSVTDGEYILPLDADDVIKPDYIEKCVERFVSHPETSLVYCEWEFFGELTKAPKLVYRGYRNLFVENTIFCSAMFRRRDFSDAGGYDEKIPYGYEDWELWLRLLKEDSVVYQIPEKLFRYRIKQVSRSSNANEKERLSVTHNYIYEKHADKYTRYFPDVIAELQILNRLRLRQEKWERRSLPSRLWHAVKGDM